MFTDVDVQLFKGKVSMFPDVGVVQVCIFKGKLLMHTDVVV